MILETVTAKLQADAGSFVTGFQRASREVDLLGARIPTTGRVVGSLQRGLGNLAFQAAGVPGPLGKISEAMLMFAGGSVLTLGVVAGVGLIAAAMNRQAKAAEESEQANRAARDALMELRAAHKRALEGMGEGSIPALRVRASELRESVRSLEALARVQERLRAGFSAMGDPVAALRMSNTLVGTLAALARLRLSEQEALDTIKRIEDERVKANDGMVKDAELALALFGQTAQEQARILAIEKNMTAEQFLRLRNAKEELATRAAIAELDARVAQKMREMQIQIPSVTGQVPGFNPADTEGFRQGAERFDQEMKNIFGDPEMLEDIQNLGISAGRQFALGIIDGFRDMADIMRSIFLTILDFAITKGLTSIIKGGPASAIDASGGGLSVAAPEMGLSVNTGALPAPMTPFDVARDRQWLRILAESNIVLRSVGAR